MFKPSLLIVVGGHSTAACSGPMPDRPRSPSRIGSRAVGVAVSALFLAALLGGCATPSPSSSPSSFATSTPRSSPSVSPTAAGPTFPPSQTAIEPGTYSWNGFQPAISLTVGSGWVLGHDNPAFFDLFRGNDFPSVSFARFTDVFVDATKQTAAFDAATVTATLQGRTDMVITEISTIDLGGLPGRQFDLATLGPHTPLFVGPAGSFNLDAEFKTRYRILDFPRGGVLVIGIHARAGAFDAGLALGEPIVASLVVVRR